MFAIVMLNDFRRSRTLQFVSSVVCQDKAVFFQCFAMNYIGRQLSKELTLNLAFKVMKGLAPSYLADIFVSVSSNPVLHRNRSTN